MGGGSFKVVASTIESLIEKIIQQVEEIFKEYGFFDEIPISSLYPDIEANIPYSQRINLGFSKDHNVMYLNQDKKGAIFNNIVWKANNEQLMLKSRKFADNNSDLIEKIIKITEGRYNGGLNIDSRVSLEYKDNLFVAGWHAHS